jgi:hypothetical protein
MPTERLYRENIRVDLAYPEAFAVPATPTAAELNNATLVKNITCALDEDGTEITLGDPDTDDSLSFCDSAGTQSATFKNPSVVLVSYRDEDRSATGVYDLAAQHISYPDVAYYVILRVGYRSTVAYATTQKIKMVGAKTDLPVSVEESGENARISNTMLNNGFVNWNYLITA